MSSKHEPRSEIEPGRPGRGAAPTTAEVQGEDRNTAKAPEKAPASSRARPRKPAKAAAGRPRQGRRDRRTISGGRSISTFVLGLWALIGVMGVIGYFAMTLPPPEELAVPERPANVMVVAADGTRAGQSRRDRRRGGTAVRAAALPSAGGDGDRGPALLLPFRHRSDRPGPRRRWSTSPPAASARAARPSPSSSPRTCSWSRSARSGARCRRCCSALWLEHKYSKDQILEMYLNRVYLGARRDRRRGGGADLFRQVGARRDAGRGGDHRRPAQGAVAICPDRQPGSRRGARADRAQRHGRGRLHYARTTPSCALISPAEVRPQTPGEAAGYVADWVWEQVPSFIGEVRQRHRRRHDDRHAHAEVGREPRWSRCSTSRAAEKGVSEGALVAMDTSGAVRAHHRRPRLREEPVQPRHQGEAPAGLVVQDLRLSRRDGGRADARDGAQRHAGLASATGRRATMPTSIAAR